MKMNTPMPALPLLLLFLFVFFPSPSTAAAGEKCHPEDKKALLSIKKSLNNPYLLASWKPEDDCCTWYCVKCHLTTRRISELTIFQGSLPGKIPAAIGDLPYLEMLVLHKLPDLSGPIPPSIIKLRRLTHLEISSVNLTGTIPAFLGRLTSLTFMDLSFNKLTGPIPAALSRIPRLSWIDLSRNQLTGAVPPELGNFRWVKLSLLLSHNQLSGPIPAALGRVNFNQIDFSRNKLEGDVSMLFGPTKTAWSVDLSRNMFEFDMSKIRTGSELTYLDLNHNKIFGSIPKEFAKLNLQGLNVSYNRLCGEIPKGGNLQKFDYSSFFHNKCLCGSPLGVACKKS